VRCVGCEIDSSAQPQYCECCGRRLSLNDMHRKGPSAFGTRQAREPERAAGREAERAAVREPEHVVAEAERSTEREPQRAAAVEQSPVPEGRCETCGAASPDGTLCPSCQQAFNAWLGNVETSTANDAAGSSDAAASNDTSVASDAAGVASEQTAVNDATIAISPSASSAAPIVNEAPSVEGAARVDQSLWSQLMNSPAPPTDDELYTPAAVAEKAPMRRISTAVADEKIWEPTTEVVKHEPTVQVASAEAIVAEPVKAPEPIRTEEERPVPAYTSDERSESTLDLRTPKASVVPIRPAVAVPSQPKRNSVPLAAAAGVVAVLGLGAYWIPNHVRPDQVVAREEQPPVVASGGAVTAPAPQPPAVVPPAEPIEDRKPVAPKAPPAARPKPTAVAKEVRTPAVRPVAVAAPVPEPVPEPPAPVVVPPPPPVVASAPSPAAPSGQFFETTDVSESPQVTKRVEPQVPDDLRNRRLNEILIVRVLVSQSGHPYRISLLRKSKTGPQLDNAVIAAVNQWTFSPAKRRGEAVSCWLNLGVPVSAS
jgi:TonB family protein